MNHTFKTRARLKKCKGHKPPISPFPDQVLEAVLSFIDSNKDRSSVSLVCRDWYDAERWTRSKLFIRNCYSVSPEIVAGRFPRIKSVILKGKPMFSDFNMLPSDWGANVHSWLVMFAKVYPFLEELRFKRVTVTDDSLELLAKSFPGFRALSLSSCDGFSDDGLKAIATHCRNLSELNIEDTDRVRVNVGGGWVSCFPEKFGSLEILNFACLSSDVSFDSLERLVSRCKFLRVLKVNMSITVDKLHRLLVLAPHLTELGTGSSIALAPHQYNDVKTAFSNCKNLQILSSLWCGYRCFFDIPLIYGACAALTFLNLIEVERTGCEVAKLVGHCPNLQRLWVTDTVQDYGLEYIGSLCPLLEELRVVPSHYLSVGVQCLVTEVGLLAISKGCPKLSRILYFCQRMTNAAVVAAVRNCPGFTHFRLWIMKPAWPGDVSDEPLDEAYAAVAKTCTKLRRLSVSGPITGAAFKCIGKYAKNLETLSVGFVGGGDGIMRSFLRGSPVGSVGSDDGVLRWVLPGCPKLRKLEIRGCPFGNAARLLSGLGKYETLRSLWMSGCNVTVKGCRALARETPRLNVEVIKDDKGSDDGGVGAEKIFVYRSVVGPRRGAPPLVLTL